MKKTRTNEGTKCSICRIGTVCICGELIGSTTLRGSLIPVPYDLIIIIFDYMEYLFILSAETAAFGEMALATTRAGNNSGARTADDDGLSVAENGGDGEAAGA